MKKPKAIDSTPGEDTNIQSNLIIRMIFYFFGIMALCSVIKGIGYHCHLSHRLERATEVMEGYNFYSFTRVIMSNVVSIEALGTDLAAELNDASITKLNKLIHDKSISNNEPKNEPNNEPKNINNLLNPNSPHLNRNGAVINGTNDYQANDSSINSSAISQIIPNKNIIPIQNKAILNQKETMKNIDCSHRIKRKSDQSIIINGDDKHNTNHKLPINPLSQEIKLININILIQTIIIKCDMFFRGESQPLNSLQYKQIIFITFENITHFRMKFILFFFIIANLILLRLCSQEIKWILNIIFINKFGKLRGGSQPNQMQQNNIKCDILWADIIRCNVVQFVLLIRAHILTHYFHIIKLLELIYVMSIINRCHLLYL